MLRSDGFPTNHDAYCFANSIVVLVDNDSIDGRVEGDVDSSLLRQFSKILRKSTVASLHVIPNPPFAFNISHYVME